MFQIWARNATTVANPVRMSGVALTRDAVIALKLPKAPWKSALKALKTSAPLVATRRPDTAKPATTATVKAPVVQAQLVSKRGSTLIMAGPPPGLPCGPP